MSPYVVLAVQKKNNATWSGPAQVFLSFLWKVVNIDRPREYRRTPVGSMSFTWDCRPWDSS